MYCFRNIISYFGWLMKMWINLIGEGSKLVNFLLLDEVLRVGVVVLLLVYSFRSVVFVLVGLCFMSILLYCFNVIVDLYKDNFMIYCKVFLYCFKFFNSIFKYYLCFFVCIVIKSVCW